ncbi:hypothetical protein AB3G33_15695 [Flavobacterium sp. WC2421]|uniref:hypothetical protein n=1 Tax=Flavobacterium sp. WC2421 TaxID=3234138 RepID=UPI003464E981
MKQKIFWLNLSDAVCVQMDCSEIVKQKGIRFNNTDAVCGEMYCGEKKKCEKNDY